MTTDTPDALAELHSFLASGRFETAGAWMTDLDGTAVIEREGCIYLPPEVELGLKRVHDAGDVHAFRAPPLGAMVVEDVQ